MKYFKTMGMLLAAIVLAAGCSKDDNDSKTDERGGWEGDKHVIAVEELTPEERLLLQQQGAMESILGQLTGNDELPDDFDEARYEPTYGVVLDESQPLVRSEHAETLADAERLFRDIVGSDDLIATTADGLSVTLMNMPMRLDGGIVNFGTLTFHPSDGSLRTAYVDVDIKCIPGLRRIDFLPKATFPQNASSPYDIGDIFEVSKGSGYCTGYYLCVRDSYTSRGVLVHMNINEPGGDESINIDGDNEGAWYPYNKSKNQTTTEDDCYNYIKFIVDNPGMVRQIKNWMNNNTNDKLYHIFPQNFNNDYKVGETYVAWHSPDGRPAHIIYDGWMGAYRYIPAYHWRHCVYYNVPQNCTRAWNCERKEYKYSYDKHFNKNVYDTGWNYTMNVIHFDDSEIFGVRKVFTPK